MRLGGGYYAVLVVLAYATAAIALPTLSTSVEAAAAVNGSMVSGKSDDSIIQTQNGETDGIFSTRHPTVSVTSRPVAALMADPASSSSSSCHRPTNHCQHLPNETCFGIPLPYDYVSFNHTGLKYIYDVQSKLSEWTALRGVPKCWAVIRPLLCGVYLSPCDADNMTVEMASRQLCRVIQGPCRIVNADGQEWPEFLRCDNDAVFNHRSGSCEDEKTPRLKFNTSSSLDVCQAPLVSTNRESAFFHEVDGCGMRCESPEFTTDEYAYYHTFLFWIAFFGLVVFAIVIGTHLICGWSDAVKSPLFYMSVCEAFIRFLLLVQFMANKESLVCAADGTRYTGGDGSYHPLCNTTAIFLFLFFAALCIEFVLFSYTFSVHVRITNPGNSEKVLAKKQPYFCMAALVIPVCLAIIIFALDFVEGDSLTGVCFVGGKNQPTARVIFVVVPICLTLCVSAYFSFRSVSGLHEVSRRSRHEKGSHKVVRTKLLRFCVFTSVYFICGGYIVFYELYGMKMQEQIDASVKDYVVCEAKRQVPHADNLVRSDCKVDVTPNGTLYALLLIFLVFAPLSHFYWMFTNETRVKWKAFLTNLINRGKGVKRGAMEELGNRRPVKKHKVIQQVYANRQRLAETGRLSVSLPSLSCAQGNNPVDLRILKHINTDTSNDFDTSFAMALPRLVQRRNAVCGAEMMGLEQSRPGTSLSRSQSMISVASRQFSSAGGGGEASRRRSFDSQMSIQPSELEYLQSIYDKGKKQKRSKRRFFNAGKSKRDRKLSRQLSIASRNDSINSFGGGGRGGGLADDNSASQFSASQFSQVLPAITLRPPPHESIGGSSVLSSDFSCSGVELKTFKRFSSDVPSQPPLQKKTNKTLSGLPSGYEELISRLGPLATANTSLDTNVAAATACASIQTSLTDLSTLGHMSTKDVSAVGAAPSMISVGTQYVEPPAPSLATSNTTTSSSSQPLRHIDANVIRISVSSKEGSTSVPSSSNGDPRERSLLGKENLVILAQQVTAATFKFPPPREIHNRGRRGGLVAAGAGGGVESVGGGAGSTPFGGGGGSEELILTVQNATRRSTPQQVESSSTS